jgi:hypothetical protein
VLNASVRSVQGSNTLVISIGTASGRVRYRFSPGVARYLHSRLGSLLDKQRAEAARAKASQKHQEMVEGTSAEAEHPAGGKR